MKAAFHTLGCKVNSYETQAVKEQFLAAGFECVGFDELSDVYVINTCAVTQTAEHKSRQMINRARELNPEAVVIATGCYVQEEAQRLAEDLNVDIVVGNNHKSEIAALAREALEGKIPHALGRVVSESLKACALYEEQRISEMGSHVRSYVKIQDGCNRFCSYCVIPYVRGRSRTRQSENILEEIRALAGSGYKEIVLTGIDVSAFKDLSLLVKRAGEVNGIERIRLSSLEPGIITPEFLKALKDTPEFCPHFHLSMQSGSDAVLKKMNRRYGGAMYLEKLALIREYFENPKITTDIITGFPGEGEKEFAETFELVKKARFGGAHIFPYSERKGTRAAGFEGRVPKKIRKERAARLARLVKTSEREYLNSLIGKKLSVLIEEEVITDGKSCLTGFSREYVRTYIPRGGAEDSGDKFRVNDIVSVLTEKEQGGAVYCSSVDVHQRMKQSMA